MIVHCCAVCNAWFVDERDGPDVRAAWDAHVAAMHPGAPP